MFGFDDERTRDEYARAVGRLREGKRAEARAAELGAAVARAVEAVAAVWRRLAEAIREAAAVLGERVRAVVEAWGLVEERARRGGPPERVNCRCAVVRVERPVVPDAVRAGRALWWRRRR
jgi:hypothetical protein